MKRLGVGVRDRRGHAGFAAVAVALLLGGGAALYLQAVDLEQADTNAAAAAELQALRLELASDQVAVEGAAYRALEAAVGTAFAGGPGAVAALSASVEASLRERLEAIYPREASASRTVGLQLVFARVFAVEADAELPSPLGGRVIDSVPAYLAIEGLVNLSAAGRGLNLSETSAFAARLPVPLLLAEALAARVAAEASPGGRVERLAGQFAQSALNAPTNRTLNGTRAAEVVRAALGAELRLDLGTSLDPTLDVAIDAAGTARGAFAAQDIFAGPVSPDEAFPVSGASNQFWVGGEARPVEVQLEAADYAQVETSASWQFFDAQELGSWIWGALRLNVSGGLALTLRVSSGRGSFEVGPLPVPIGFEAHALQAPVPAETAVSPAHFASAMAVPLALSPYGPYAPTFQRAGVPTGPDGNYSDNATTRAALAPLLYEDLRASLPPVEDTAAFEAAHAPEVWRYTGGTLRVNATLPVEGARALVTLDGAVAASGPLRGGALEIPRLPEGLHALRLSVVLNGTLHAGGTMVSVGGEPWDAEVALAPVLPLDFFNAALARGEAAHDRPGMAMLDEAAQAAGLPPAGAFATVADAAAFGEEALARLTALDLSSLASAKLQERNRDAASFLKIMIGLLRAADAAYKEHANASLPIGALAGETAKLTLRADPTSLVAVTLAGTTLATAVAARGAVAVTFAVRGEPPRTLQFPGDRLLLVLNSLAGALTLAADGVRIEQAFAADSTADLGDKAIVVAATALDFATLAYGVARGVYALYGKAVLDSMGIPFLKVATVLSAATVLLDLAALYHEKDGNFTAMAEELIHPGSVGGLSRLPGLLSGATTVVANLLYLSGAIAEPLGPLGIAVGLFALAALIVANKAKVASALWGTLPYEAVDEVRAQVADAVKLGFTGAAVANTLSLGRLAQARRAASASAAQSWLSASTDANEDAATLERASAERARGSALSIGTLLRGTLRLRAAAGALVEELDDFASPPYDIDAGRLTEGYRALHTLAGDFAYRGNVVVVDAPEGTHGRELIRAEWRELLATLTTGEVANRSFAFDLTDTNAIPQGQFSLWSAKVTAAGGAFESAFNDFDAAASRLRPAAA